MTPESILAAMKAEGRNFCTPDEVAALVRDGTYEQVGEAMVRGGCLDDALRKRFTKLHRERKRAELP